MTHDIKAWAAYLKESFPKEHKAIDEYLQLVREYREGFDMAMGVLKLLPLSLANLVIKMGLVRLINKKWGNDGGDTTKDIVER